MGLASEKKTEECVNKIGQLEGKKFQTLKNLWKIWLFLFLIQGNLSEGAEHPSKIPRTVSIPLDYWKVGNKIEMERVDK